MTFWQQVFSVGGFAVASVCTLLGVLIGHWLAQAAKRKDDRAALIQDVASRYNDLASSLKSSGLDALIKSGVIRLANAHDIEDAIIAIKKYGHSDPLSTYRTHLTNKDLYDFIFQVVANKHINPIRMEQVLEVLKITNPAKA